MSTSSNTIPKPEDYAPFHLEAFYRLERDKGSDFANATIDSALVTYTRDTMTNKLKHAAKQGHKNWWKKEDCSIDDLKELHAKHVDKGEFLDAGIFAMFIHARQCAEFLEQEGES